MPNIFHYNILVTLDRNYLKVLSVMLYSLSQSDPDAVFTVYVANNSLTEDDFSSLRTLIPRTEFVDVRVCDELLSGAPISDRYPKEMYFRLFAAQYLPQELDRILYLDPDLCYPQRSARALFHRLSKSSVCRFLPHRKHLF